VLDWSKSYSGQQEIHQYMIGVAKKYKLYKQIQLETEVVRASWLEDRKKWELELKTPDSKESRLAYYDLV
jgi:cation diffusion facilitator CzcD-associated flavoprotein CzcO